MPRLLPLLALVALAVGCGSSGGGGGGGGGHRDTGPTTPTAAALPSLVGQSSSDARTLLASHHYAITTDGRYGPEPQGTVIGQNPVAGTVVSFGGKVTLVVSLGGTAVPDVVGLAPDAADSALSTAGFRPRGGTAGDTAVITQVPVAWAAPHAIVTLTTQSGRQATLILAARAWRDLYNQRHAASPVVASTCKHYSVSGVYACEGTTAGGVIWRQRVSLKAGAAVPWPPPKVHHHKTKTKTKKAKKHHP